MKIEETTAEQLKPGDTVRLQFMGGTEDVEVDDVIHVDNDTVRLVMFNSVTGTISDTVDSNLLVRKVI